MENLVRRHVDEDEVEHFARVHVLRDLDGVFFQDADALGIRAPDGQRADAIADLQPLATRTDLFDYADELIARRERRPRYTEVGAGPQH